MAVQKLYYVFNKLGCIKWFCVNDNLQSGTYMFLSSWHIMENIGLSVPDHTTFIAEYSCLHSYLREKLKGNRRSSRIRSEKTETHTNIQHRMTGDYLRMKLRTD